MRELAERDPNRIVIVDAPPLHAGTEAGVLARIVGHVVVLVEADKTAQSTVEDALHQLKGCESVSLVLNKARRRSSDRTLRIRLRLRNPRELAAVYQDFFGLSGKPFQLSPDARFFYPSKEHKRALSFLQYGLGQGDGFIVITGDIGTGKTTLVQTLLADLDPKVTVVANIVTTQLKEDDLLTLVAFQFGLRSTGSKAVLLRDLEQFFLHRTRERKRVLLIVDEAQNLPPQSVEELRMLSNFQYQGRPLVQVFLLGQEEFRATLLSPGFEQLRQRIIATYHLNPLEAAETRTYIEHRLRLVGWRADPTFSDGAFERIYAFTQGCTATHQQPVRSHDVVRIPRRVASDRRRGGRSYAALRGMRTTSCDRTGC